MSCEINDNPCDECEEKYCPDMLEDAHNMLAALKSTLAFHEKRVEECHEALLAHLREHNTILDPAGVRHRPLSRAASLARNDLTMSLHFLPEHQWWRPLQSIRMITEDLQDAEAFEIIWNRWNEVDVKLKQQHLPPFKEMMEKK